MPIAYHDNTHSPIGNWPLDGSLVDISGNNYHLSMLDLFAASAPARYSEAIPGVRGLAFNGAAEYAIAGIALSSAPLLRRTGDITIECFVAPSDEAYQQMYVSAHHTRGGNVYCQCYGLGTAETNPVRPTTCTNHGVAGELNSIYSTIDALPGQGYYRHLALTRIANVNRIYENGRLLRDASGTLTTPGVGDAGTGYFCIGFGVLNPTVVFCTGVVASVKVLDFGLSDAQVLAEYNRTIGIDYPRAV